MSDLESGRSALAERAWDEAFALLWSAAKEQELGPEDLERLGDAAWCSGRYAECIDARERAYAAYLEEGNRAAAAAVASVLAADYFAKADIAVATGWGAQADRLLEELPEGPVHGTRAYSRAFLALTFFGDLELAVSEGARAAEIGKRFGDRSVEMLGRSAEGMALAKKGSLAEGTAKMDEAMTAAVAGELRPRAAQLVFCHTIFTCQRLLDFRRAREWTEATGRSSARLGGVPASGDCRVHRADVLRIGGAWADAESEARRGCDECEGWNPGHAGGGEYLVGEVRLLRGDLAGAEKAFERAHEMGYSASAGLAMVRLAQGNVDAAMALITEALADPMFAPQWDTVQRLWLLPRQAEIALAAGDVDVAAAATEELESAALTYGTSGVKASAATARGSLHLHEDALGDATRTLREACRLWNVAEAPYECARTRVLLAECFHRIGSEESRHLELRAALSTFERLGALPDAAHVRELLGEREQPLTLEKTFMFTDIVRSTDLAEAMGDEAWESIMRWHDDALRSVIADHRGEEIKHTGDGFFVSFDEPRDALSCAIGIQTSLAQHRRQHAFAPEVRIGLHSGKASRRGSDYTGGAVNTAARLGALAEGGEILVSAATSHFNFTVSEPRSVKLKGVKSPLDVVSVSWERGS